MELGGLTVHEAGPLGFAVICFCIVAMFLSASCFYWFATQTKASRCLLQAYCMAICGISTLTYAIMAMNSGFIELPGRRPICWVRYVDWIVTIPLVIYVFSALAGCRTSQTMMLIFLSLFAIVSGICATVLRSWTFFVGGIVVYVPLLVALSGGFGKLAKRRKVGKEIRTLITHLSIVTVIGCFFYPIIWFLGEGSESIETCHEILAYSVLDLISKSIFGFLVCCSECALKKVSRREITSYDMKA